MVSFTFTNALAFGGVIFFIVTAIVSVAYSTAYFSKKLFKILEKRFNYSTSYDEREMIKLAMFIFAILLYIILAGLTSSLITGNW